MNQDDILFVAPILLMLVLLPVVSFLFWKDVIRPRRQRPLIRQQRRRERWAAKFRMGFLSDSWGLRRTRRLTDQRQAKRDEV